MYDFDYCIWLCPDKNSVWNTYTKGFPVHITIYKYLDKKDAITLFTELKQNVNNLNIKVKLTGELEDTATDDFNAIEHEVEVVNMAPPKWWPIDAHVSFAYQYDKEFTEKEVNELQKTLHQKEMVFTHFKVVKCVGHYKDWK